MMHYCKIVEGAALNLSSFLPHTIKALAVNDSSTQHIHLCILSSNRFVQLWFKMKGNSEMDIKVLYNLFATKNNEVENDIIIIPQEVKGSSVLLTY